MPATPSRDLPPHEAATEFLDRCATSKLIGQLDEERNAAVEQLKASAYLHRQIAWLQDRFPTAEMQHVPGLCKVVTRAEIEAANWSLTPGRFVGVAPAEMDEDFDFEQTLRDIHVELAELNREAGALAARNEEPRPKGRGIKCNEHHTAHLRSPRRGTPQAAGNLPAMIQENIEGLGV